MMGVAQPQPGSANPSWQSFTPDNTVMLQRKKSLSVFVVCVQTYSVTTHMYIFAQGNKMWPVYANNRNTSMSVAKCITVDHLINE